MPKKSGFKISKVQWQKKNYNSSIKRNSLIFCSFVLLICSVIVRFIQTFVEWIKDLFLSYTNLQQYSQQNNNSEWENITLTWDSLKNIQLSFYSTPSYIVAWWDVMLSRYIGTLGKREGYDRVFKEWNYNPLNEFKNCKSDNCMLFLNL